uniref:Uncharacterized protein n=1 Tax=Amphimedon queenslandica TaxID=400682 RepID=A0A1X7UKJ7_AMPQE
LQECMFCLHFLLHNGLIKLHFKISCYNIIGTISCLSLPIRGMPAAAVVVVFLLSRNPLASDDLLGTDWERCRLLAKPVSLTRLSCIGS